MVMNGARSMVTCPLLTLTAPHLIPALHAKLGHFGPKTFQLSLLVLAEVRILHPVTVPDLHLSHFTQTG